MIRPKRRSSDNGNNGEYKQRSIAPDLIKIVVALIIGGSAGGGYSLFNSNMSVENEKRIVKLETQRLAEHEILESKLETINVKIDNLLQQLKDLKHNR